MAEQMEALRLQEAKVRQLAAEANRRDLFARYAALLTKDTPPTAEDATELIDLIAEKDMGLNAEQFEKDRQLVAEVRAIRERLARIPKIEERELDQMNRDIQAAETTPRSTARDAALEVAREAKDKAQRRNRARDMAITEIYVLARRRPELFQTIVDGEIPKFIGG
jgi:hypothetical protein